MAVEDEAVSVEESAPPAPVLCQFCDAPAEAACPRCGTVYCAQHGDAACDACSDPATGLPSPRLLWATLATFGVGAVLALYLLLFSPRLPGEQPPPPGAGPALPTSAAGGNAPGQGAETATGAAASPAPSPTRRTYTIKQGDTLGALAAEFGVSVENLRAANPGINEAALQIGQEIMIP